MKAVLAALSHCIGELLGEGRRVHIDGLGYFQMTLKCPPAKLSNEVRGDKVEFKSVSFRAEKELKDKLKKTKFLRAEKRSIHSPKYSESEMDSVLTGYFEKNTYITRLAFSRLFNFTTSTARNRLIRLVEAGKLKKKGSLQSPFYEPGEGYYSRVKEADSV